MSKLFHLVEDASVIVRTKNGIYKQAKVFRRGRDVYAGHGADFVRIMGDNGTSCPSILWSDLECDGVEIPRLGNPRFPEVDPLAKAA